MINCIYFDETEELSKLTGLNRTELWENGFDLDDWDYGLCCNRKFPKYSMFLERLAICACKCTKFGGKYYYLFYHS